MIQKNLDGKEVIEKKKCQKCGKYREYLYSGFIYQPFDDEPTWEYNDLCENCEMAELDNVFYCEECGREIFYSNGYRKNIRIELEVPEFIEFDENGMAIYDIEYPFEVICAKCAQEIWFETGMANFQDADWFSESELSKSDFVKDKSYFCQTQDCYDNAKNRFNELRKKGYAVIVSLESSGMGLEHFFSLWKKGG